MTDSPNAPISSPVVDLKLTLDAVNGIISVLAKLPFEQVYGLINDIRSQTEAQLQSFQPVTNEPPTPSLDVSGNVSASGTSETIN